MSATVTVCAAGVEHGRLRAYLADLAVDVVAIDSGDGVSVEGPTGAVSLRPPGGVDRTYWLAGRVRRLVRTVPDAAGCASPGLECLLSAEYRHPGRPSSGERAECLVLIDPRMRVTADTLREFAARAAECGYVIRTARRFGGADIARRRLAYLHYLPHAQNADEASLDVFERARLLAIYDVPAFAARHRCPAPEVEVVATERFRRDHGVPTGVISNWSRASTGRRGLDSGALDGPNRLGDCLSVNVFQDRRYAGGRPFFLVNPHMIDVLGAFEAPAAECCLFHLQAQSPMALPLGRLRAELCGATDPARAHPGSIRGDALAGLYPLRGADGTPVARWNNGIHMSNGAWEAVRELRLWFGVDRRGPPHPSVLVNRAWIEHHGRRRALGEVAAGMTRAQLARLLRSARLASSAPRAPDPARDRRLGLAWAVAKRLRDGGGVLGVIGLGRGFRDAAVEVLAVTTAPSAAGDAVLGAVRVRYLDLDAVEALLARAGSLEDLRAAARVGTGVPLWDPDRLTDAFAARSAALLPPAALAMSLLDEATSLLESVRATGPERSTLRRLDRTLAVLLLSLHPIRYDRAQWAVEDLRSIGQGRLAAALLRSSKPGRPLCAADVRAAAAATAEAQARVRDCYAVARARAPSTDTSARLLAAGGES